MVDLLAPLVFRNGVRARNRCVVAAMTNQQSHADGTVGDAELAFLGRRAAGGFGVVTTCASHVTRDGQGWPGELGCFADAHVPGLRRLADAVHAHGALGLVQVFHAGLRADATVTGTAPLTASVGPHVPNLVPGARAATTDDLARIIDAFGAAAARCQAAGWDGVEIHGAHGYLLTQFLSAHNDRADGWGGDLPGRARLLREVVRAVRARVPASCVVVVRLSPEDAGTATGLDLDESVTVAQQLVADGADAIHVSLPDARKPSRKRPEVAATEVVRAALPPDVPVLVAGRIWSRADADAALAHGADAVAVARAAIAHPDWPRQVADPAAPPPRLPPFSAAEMAARDVAPGFTAYLGHWRGLIDG